MDKSYFRIWQKVNLRPHRIIKCNESFKTEETNTQLHNICNFMLTIPVVYSLTLNLHISKDHDVYLELLKILNFIFLIN